MKAIKIAISIISVLAFFSCEKEIPLKIDNVEQKVVLNSLVYSDSIMRVALSTSAVLGSGQKTAPIANAQIKLYVNGTFQEELQERYSGLYLSEQPLMANTDYHVEVISEKGNVSATTSIPAVTQSVSIDSANAINVILDSYMGSEQVCQVWVSFINPPGDNNYLLRVKAFDSIYNDYYYPAGMFYFDVDHMATSSEIGGEILINTYPYLRLPDDDLTPGKNTFKFGFRPNNYNGSNEYYLEFCSLNEAFYSYITSIEVYETVQYDFFAEPMNVFSNISGGLGVFAGASCIQAEFPEVQFE
ncbi:MAG: DUF4249 domain-containing protein [Salinivirgaceae bacterium]|jgi:hypothetical protein|nr:DUF4249 domain-containing protein [Salinivirgaceae bacterium]